MNGDLDGGIRQAVGLPRDVFTSAQVQALQEHIRREWQREADCAECGAEVWFLDRGTKTPRVLQVVCADCPVRGSCLASAVLVGELGVWAGTSYEAREAAGQRIASGSAVDRVLAELLRAAQPKPAHRAAPRNQPPAVEGGFAA